ncbi:MAG: D-glycerate dehydrogenase [Pseudomonadota bacterium]
MAKVLISRRFPDSIVARAKTLFDADIHNETTPISQEARAEALSTYDGILATLGDTYAADLFEQPNLRTKIISNFGVGYNHIDAAAAAKAGVQVTNTPGVLTDATADIAMTLMMMVARRASEGERMVRANQWEGWHPTQLIGQDITGRTLGIIGFGRIGQAMACKAHFGFGMRIVFQNRSPKTVDFPAEQLSSIEAVCAEADVVAIHAPGAPENKHLFNAAHFAAMKPSGIFINTARGDVVDEDALIETLEQGKIFGAGLDVYEYEPIVPDRLKALENVVLLPHLGSASLPVREAMGNMALDNLEAFFAGKPVPNPV